MTKPVQVDYDKFNFIINLGGKKPDLSSSQTEHYDYKKMRVISLRCFPDSKVGVDYDKANDTLTIHSNPIKIANGNISSLGKHLDIRTLEMIYQALSDQIGIPKRDILNAYVLRLDIKFDIVMLGSFELFRKMVDISNQTIDISEEINFQEQFKVYPSSFAILQKGKRQSRSDFVLKVYDKALESDKQLYDKVTKAGAMVLRIEGSWQTPDLLNKAGIVKVMDCTNLHLYKRLVEQMHNRINKLELQFVPDSKLESILATEDKLPLYEAIKRKGGVDPYIKWLTAESQKHNSPLNDYKIGNQIRKYKIIFSRFDPYDKWNLKRQKAMIDAIKCTGEKILYAL